MKKLYFVLALLFSFSASTFAQTLHTVNSGSYYYTPSNFTINVGDTVTWLNDGGLHNVNFDVSVITGNSFGNPESFASSPTTGPVLYTHVFTIPGSYSYDCSVGAHAQNGMVGSLTVNGPPSNSIYDIVSNSTDHTTLKVAVDACSLDGTLSGAGPFTLFAPTDAAFNALPSGTVPALLNDIPTLTNILLHHVVGDSVMSGMLSNGQIVTTLAGTDLTVTINTSGVFIDNAQVTVADVIADNGVVHVIDAVLLPPTPDCNGIVGGTSLLDSCGVCQQAYIYNFSTNIPTFLNDTTGVIVGPGEALIMPNDPSNPLWNSSCSGCTDPAATNYDPTATIDNGTCVYSNSVYDIVSNSVDHTTLKAAVDACSLDGTLSGAGPFTLFAPTDAAFNALPQGTVAALLNDLPLLTNILLHHVVGDSVMSGMLSNGQVVTTLLGTDVTVTINTSGVFIDNAQVTVADVIADNGVVHVIDAVLLPNPGCTDPTATNYDANAIVDDGSCTYATNTVYDVVVTSLDHNLLEVAIDTCSLDGTLSGAGPFTLFAPTDAAFNALPQGTVAALLNDLPLLTNILLHHVVGDSVMSGMLSNGQVVTTLLGTDVTVTINTSGVFIDNAQVTVADVIADNGVVHVIDAVLLPNPGCTDPTATNYDANAIVDDGSCTYATNTIYDVVVTSPDHTYLEIGIDTCGFDAYLSGPGPFTLFAPTDAAFNALPPVTLLALLNDIPQLTNILKHHVVGDSVMSGMLSNGQVITTLLGTDVTVTINSSGVFIDNAQVTVVDIVADNGVVHVIDAVLLPPAPSNTIYDIISKSSDHTVLTLAIDTCGLAGTLKGAGPFTVFAPTDAAFNALPSGTIAALLNDLPQLTDILLHHVVGDSVMSGMLTNGQTVTTLLGDDVTVTINTSGVYIDNAMVTVADIVADNGVVHVIDAVLLPSSTGINNINDSNVYEYMYSINLLGERVNRSKRNQVVLDIYSNGKVVKRFNP